MRKDSRLSRMLHVLLHMARHDGPMTSEHIAKMLQTNPVVVRRTMAGLRDAGYVSSEKGHGGGWVIAADLEKVSLLDIHRAVGGPSLFAIGAEHDNPACAVERAVNGALEDALREAEALLVARLGAVNLAALARSFDAQCVAGGWNAGTGDAYGPPTQDRDSFSKPRHPRPRGDDEGKSNTCLGPRPSLRRPDI